MDEIDEGWKIVRGMIEAAEQRVILTLADRETAFKQVKQLVGILIEPPRLHGERGLKKDADVDAAVIADIPKFGTIPKAVRAYLANGRLSKGTTERSHIERIRERKKHMI
ncbi:hypothetical protein [Bradyrhizobium sp. UFLA03-84]|uniref:hypothetical protein n=1 Tax=Bradyrhizobium sp. UFLA03-84 TaxID=418599 RepID=UPI001177AAA9|nr:hypothetical protein [Bradyrhizobium sp. UFLA03-84]